MMRSFRAIFVLAILTVFFRGSCVAADFAIFGGSGGSGGGSAMTPSSGGAGSVLSTIGGKGGNDAGNDAGGGGGQGGHIDGSSPGVGGTPGGDSSYNTGGAGGTSPEGTTGDFNGGNGGNGGLSPSAGSPGGLNGGGGGGGGLTIPSSLAGGTAGTYKAAITGSEYAIIAIEGGNGGGGGGVDASYVRGGGGGDGAGAKGTTDHDVVATSRLDIQAGAGGKGGNTTSYGGFGGKGGDGGDAVLDAAGYSVEVRGAFTMKSGANGAPGDNGGAGTVGVGGDGGDAVFTAGTLTAQTMNLTKQDGGLTFNATTLKIADTGTTLTATGLGAGGATIGTLLLTNDKTFSLSGANVDLGQLKIDGGTLNNTNFDTFVTSLTFTTNSDIDLGTGGATVDITADKTISRNLVGVGGLVKSGSATLILSGTNTYTGGTTVSSGALSIASDNNIGTGTNTLNGGTLRLTGANYTKDWTLGAGGNGITVDSTATMSGVLSGMGGFTLSGGSLTLSGNNSYTGTTTVSAGTLVVNGVLGGGAYAGNIIHNGTGLTFDQTAAQTLSGIVSGTGALTKSGSGTLTLSNNSSGYAGTFTQSAGGVHLTGTGNLGGAFTQNAGAFTSASGATLGAATFKGTVTPTGTLNVASAIFDGAAVNLGLLTNANTIASSGAIDFTGGTTINLDVASATSGTIYTLMTSTALTGDDTISFNAANLAAGSRTGYVVDNNDLKFSFLTGSNNLTWAGTALNGDWNTTDNNWNLTGDPSGIMYTFLNRDTVTFGATGEKSVNVASTGVSVGGMTVLGSGYTFNIDAAGATPAITAANNIALGDAILNITGYTPDESSPHNAPVNTVTVVESTGGAITGYDASRVTVAGAPTADFLAVSSKLVDSDKKIQIETGLTWNSTDPNRKAHGDFTIADGNTFTLGAALDDNDTSPNLRPGWDGKSLTKKGLGTLLLTGSNTYTGATTVSGGTLSIGVDDNIGGGTNTLSGGKLLLTGTSYAKGWTVTGTNNGIENAAATTFFGALAGTGSLAKTGIGILTLSGDSSGFTGAFVQSAGGIHLAATGRLGGSFTQESGLSFTSADGARLGASTFKGTVTPMGTLNVASADFDGATIALGDLTAGTAGKIASTGTVDFASATTITGSANVTGSYTLVTFSSADNKGNATINITTDPGQRGGSYFNNTNTALMYDVIAGAASLTWAGTAANSEWNTTTTNNSWSNGQINTWFVNGDTVTFDNSAVNKNVTVASTGVQVDTMAVSGSGYTFNLAANGSLPAIDATGTVDLGNAVLNITGYAPGNPDPYTAPVNVQTLIQTGGLSNFNAAVTVLGQATVDFLSASAYQDGNDVKVETRLTWNSSDPNRKAHGDFTIADGNTFTLGAVLADNNASTNRRSDWDGTSLTKKDGGTLVLTAVSTYGGLTDVQGGTLELANGSGLSGTGGFTLAADATLSRAGGGTASINGPATLGGTVKVSAGNVMDFADNVTFLAGSTLDLAATNATDLGKLTAGGSVTFQGATKLVTGGNQEFYHGQVAIEAIGGIVNAANLTSDFFRLRYDGSGRLSISSLKDVHSIQDNLFGSDQSGNLKDGASYTDTVIESGANPNLDDKLEDYIADLDSTSLSKDDQYRAFQHLYAEYAVYHKTAHKQSLNRHWSLVGDHVRQDYAGGRITGALSRGLSAPDALASPSCRVPLADRIWGGGFGTWADRDSKDLVSGYEFDGGGFILGYDHRVGDRLLLGFAGSYTRGKTKVNDQSAEYDADIMNLGLYASYRHPSNFYAKAGLGFGYGWNDYDVNLAVPGKKHGKYDTQSYSANLEIGYIWELPACFNLIPSAGIDYTYLHNDGWTESASGQGVANWFSSGHDDIVDIPLAVRLDRVWDLGGGRYIAPEISAAWIYSAGDKRPAVNTGYAGISLGMIQRGVNPGRNRWQFGAGVKARLTERLEARLDYNFEYRSGYKGHNLNATVGLSF